MSRLTSDRAYLEGLIDGSVDPLGARVKMRLMPMFARYPEGTRMHAILVRAADVYGDTAVRAAYWVLAEQAAMETIEIARRKAEF